MRACGNPEFRVGQLTADISPAARVDGREHVAGIVHAKVGHAPNGGDHRRYEQIATFNSAHALAGPREARVLRFLDVGIGGVESLVGVAELTDSARCVYGKGTRFTRG